VVAEIGDSSDTDQIYRLTYDGSVADERGYAVMGGAAEAVGGELAQRYTAGEDLAATLRAAAASLARGGAPEGERDRQLGAAALEVAVLDRTRTRQRKFRRITNGALAALLSDPAN